MFTTKNLFSTVPCPYAESCLLPRCIFKHINQIITSEEPLPGSIKDQKIIKEPIANEYFPLTGTSRDLKVHTQRKDVSKASETKAENSKVSIGQLPRGSVDESVKKRKIEASVGPHDAINPQAQKRKVVDNKTGLPTKTLSKTSSSSQPSSLDKSSVGSQVKPSLAARKPISKEALNPRALKVPAPASHELRYRLLTALHSQFSRLNAELAKNHTEVEAELLLCDQSLITRALDFEEEIATVSPIIYSNLIKNKILFYKRMNVKQWVEERVKEISEAKKSLEDVSSSGSRTVSSKLSETPKPIETGLSPEEELQLIFLLKTDLTGLSKYGYVTVIPTDKEIEAARKGVETAKGWEVCDRCKNRFEVFPGRREEDGALTSGGQCTYHYDRAYFPDRSVTIGDHTKWEKKFRCCGEAIGDSPGCTTAPCHVFKISEVKRLASILNFEKTPLNMDHKNTKRPICIDGEMGYTVYGLELIRLTATSWPDGQDLFDILVRPFGPILDLNSRFSGVYPEDIADALPWTPDSSNNTTTHSGLRIVSSPAEARSLLFSYLTPGTPLIGHGLENDLNATRVIHPTIIDTALLFPHSLGLPYRNSLKSLVKKHLNREIQDVGTNSKAGHDSKEDANAAGDLVKFALKIRKNKINKVDHQKQ